MEHYGVLGAQGEKTLFNEFQGMFRELKRDRKHDKEVNLGKVLNSTDGPEIFDQNQEIIDQLVSMRYTENQYSFLMVTEMNLFEQHAVYKDKYPLFNLRMKMWMWYM